MYFDVSMPLTLFIVTIVAMFIDPKIQGKLKGALQEKEFRTRDAVLLVAAMSVTISLIVFVPQLTVMLIFLFSYSMLLFLFTYLFSDFQKTRAKMFFTAFLIGSFAVATFSIFSFGANIMLAYGALAFYAMSLFAFAGVLYDAKRVSTKERWYLAVLPPALFILLYVFYSMTPVWFPYILDSYALVFAVLVILYLGSLFTWKTSLIFAGLLTVMDIVLVLFTGTMVSAARQIQGLRLPVLVSVPTLPQIVTDRGLLYMSLGLGDFFFAGLLAIQTHKKYGRNLAIVSALAMTISFSIFEIAMLNYEIPAFPGTLMIICGWLPIVGAKWLSQDIAPALRNNVSKLFEKMPRKRKLLAEQSS